MGRETCALTLIGRCNASGCWASLKEVCDKIVVREGRCWNTNRVVEVSIQRVRSLNKKYDGTTGLILSDRSKDPYLCQ